MIFAYFLCGCYLLKIYIDIFMYFWYTLVEVSRPVWRNGRRDGLKIRCWKQRVGSSPTTGTIFFNKNQSSVLLGFLCWLKFHFYINYLKRVVCFYTVTIGWVVIAITLREIIDLLIV